MPDSVLGKILVDMGGGAFSGGGGPTTSVAGGNGNGADKAAKEQQNILGQIRNSAGKTAKDMGSQPRWWTKALKTMGIQMGISGILKQSQIFTSTLGSLFQILGAFVDIMLAPWIPIIVPGLRKLADQIPRMRVAAQKFFDWATGKPWYVISKIGEILAKLFSRSWWTQTIQEGMTSLKDSLPDMFDPILDGISGVSGKLGTVGVAISGLAATWAAAKIARYGLQATRYIPFVNTFTEPVRLLSKGIDKLFNKTASVLGGLLGKVVDSLLVKLNLKTPKVPATGGTRGANLGDDFIPPVRDPRVTPRAVNQSRWFRRTPVVTPPRTPVTTGPAGSHPTPLDNYRANYEQIDWESGGSSKASTARTSGPDVTGGGQSDEVHKMTKANQAISKFRTWLGDFMTKAPKMAAKGGSGIKMLVDEGFKLAGKAISASKFMPPLLKAAAALGSRFIKAIPFLGAAYMGAETTFDLHRIGSSQHGWTGDLTSMDAWMSEAKGVFASFMGEGKLGWLNPVAKLSQMGLDFAGKHLGMEGLVDKKNETFKRWKEAQGSEGALSSGKALDFGIRAITGYGGAAASFLPLIGQLVGGAAYEGGRYATTGMNLPFAGHVGTDKYGETEMTDVLIDKLVAAFGAMTTDMTLDGQNAHIVHGIQ